MSYNFPNLSITRRVAVIAAAVALVGVIVLINLVRSYAETVPADPASFRDDTDGLSFSIQLQTGRRDSGAFAFTVDGVGSYEGTITPRPTGNVEHLQGTVSAVFHNASNGTPAATFLRFEGIIKGTRGTSQPEGATINIFVGHQHYLFQASKANAGSAPAAAQRALDAIARYDWATVYALSSKDVTSTFTESDFAASLNGQSLPPIISAHFTGDGQVITAAGFSYWSQPFTMTARNPDGSTHTYTSIIHLISESGTWRLLGTDPPQ